LRLVATLPAAPGGFYSLPANCRPLPVKPPSWPVADRPWSCVSIPPPQRPVPLAQGERDGPRMRVS